MIEAIVAAILDAADEGVIVFGRDGRCAFAGRRIGELFGVDHAGLIGRPGREVLATLAEACEEPENLLYLADVAGAGAVQRAELELRRPRVRVAEWHSSPILDAHGPAGWLGIVRDVTRERAAERRAQQLAQRLEAVSASDPLTQLPNQRRFFEEMEREHGRAARAWDSYAILRVDVDGMLSLNEELGRPRGDQLLEQIADRLRDGRRGYDLLARMGGDEFVLLLSGADLHSARVVAQRISDTIARRPVELGVPRSVTVSIGGALWTPPSRETGGDVVRRAGDALVEAKRRGRRAICVEPEAG